MIPEQAHPHGRRFGVMRYIRCGDIIVYYTDVSLRPDNAKDTLCRNVMIYGHCRFEDKGLQPHEMGSLSDRYEGCAFNHNTPKASSGSSQVDKKRFNIDSPSFTPLNQPQNGIRSVPKAGGFSPKAANAVPFRPKSSTTSLSGLVCFPGLAKLV